MMQQPIFNALADPTRREILKILAEREMSVEVLSRRFPVSRPAISKHLKILHAAGLVHEHKEGRQRFYETQLEQLSVVRDWLHYFDKFWDDRLQVLKKLVEEESDATNPAD